MTAALAHRAIPIAVFGVLATSTAGAQQRSLPSSFDRTVVPPAGKAPELHVPSWTSARLSNGAQLVVSEERALPLVSFSVTFVGGADQYEPADKTGVARFTASMLMEGTTTRTGDQLSNALQLLGTSISSSVAGETGTIGFLSTTKSFAPTLDILADVLQHPTFPDSALERLRARTLVSLQQEKDRGPSIAAKIFPKVLYTTTHPYGRSITEETAKEITRQDVHAFFDAYYRPAHAIITVVGDITPADARRVVEHALAGWQGGSMPSFDYPAPPLPHSTTIYLVDRPGAAQSSFLLGQIGPPRSTPDYYAIRVMNELFGVLFQSRLNHDIREVKGWSYGVGSAFGFGKGPGAFRAGGEIVTAKTDSALLEFMSEIRGIRGDQPPSDEEMRAAKAALVQSLPEDFASVEGVNGAITSIYTNGLPQTYYQQFAGNVDAVTKDDVVRVARQYVDPEHLAIVIVGDRRVIEAPIEATHVAPVVVLDVNGDPAK